MKDSTGRGLKLASLLLIAAGTAVKVLADVPAIDKAGKDYKEAKRKEKALLEDKGTDGE